MVFDHNTIVSVGNTNGLALQGPLYSDACWTTKGLGNTWRNNRWHVASGSYYNPATDDGKYWWPGGERSTVDYAGP
jgi:hypothetical protein